MSLRFAIGMCLIITLIAGTYGQTITATATSPNGINVNESSNFTGCVSLSQSPPSQISIGVQVSSPLGAQLDVNFGNPIPEVLLFTTTTTERCFIVPTLRDNIVQDTLSVFISFNSVDIALRDTLGFSIIDTDYILVGFPQRSFVIQENESIQLCANVIQGEIGPATPSIQLIASFQLTQATADSGFDFTDSFPVLSFTEGNSQSCAMIEIIDDLRVEGQESFTVMLVPVGDESEQKLRLDINNASATINIIDNDVALIDFERAMYTINEGNFGTQNDLRVCAQLILSEAGSSSSLQREVRGSVIAMSDTALSGQDFLPLNQSISFSSGSVNGTLVCFRVTIIGDNAAENAVNENFTLSLTAQPPDSASPNEAVVTIIHDGDTNDCRMLPNISNGIINISGFQAGSEATYSCSTNFVLRDGLSTRMCQNNGVWSGMEPRCAAICPTITIENGVIVFSNGEMIEGQNATARCFTGYAVTQGDRVRVCQNNNTWNGEEPRCTFVDCGPLTGIQNGRVSQSSTIFQATATYTCFAGYTLSGSRTRICTENGVWSGTEPDCNGAPKSVIPTGAFLLFVSALLSGVLGRMF